MRNLRRRDRSGSLSRPSGGVTSPDYHLVVKKPASRETVRVKLDGLKTYTSKQEMLEGKSTCLSHFVRLSSLLRVLRRDHNTPVWYRIFVYHLLPEYNFF